MAKKVKTEVDYSEGKIDARCELCKHFMTNNRCELVAGYIDPEAWCELFKHDHSSR